MGEGGSRAGTLLHWPRLCPCAGPGTGGCSDRYCTVAAASHLLLQRGNAVGPQLRQLSLPLRNHRRHAGGSRRRRRRISGRWCGCWRRRHGGTPAAASGNRQRVLSLLQGRAFDRPFCLAPGSRGSLLLRRKAYHKQFRQAMDRGNREMATFGHPRSHAASNEQLACSPRARSPSNRAQTHRDTAAGPSVEPFKLERGACASSSTRRPLSSSQSCSRASETASTPLRQSQQVSLALPPRRALASRWFIQCTTSEVSGAHQRRQ